MREGRGGEGKNRKLLDREDERRVASSRRLSGRKKAHPLSVACYLPSRTQIEPSYAFEGHQACACQRGEFFFRVEVLEGRVNRGLILDVASRLSFVVAELLGNHEENLGSWSTEEKGFAV